MKKDKTVISIIILGILIVVIAVVPVLLTFRIPQRVFFKIKSITNNTVTVDEEKIDLEVVDKPYTIFFIADTHITKCDERDGEILDKSKVRNEEFKVDSKDSAKNFEITMDYVKKNNPDLVIFGGDIIDSATLESIEFVEKELKELDCPYVFITGNHDFEYGREYFSETAYLEYLPRLSNLTDIEKGYEILELEDFTILGADDAGNQLYSDIKDGIKEAEKSGKPVIVITHVPFVPFENKEELVVKTNEIWGAMGPGDSRTLMGYGGIMPDGDTQEMMKFIAKEDSPVKLVLSGHVHFYHKDVLTNNINQVITGPGYKRNIVKITLY